MSDDQRIIPNQGEIEGSDHLSVSDDALGVYMFKVFTDSRKLRIGDSRNIDYWWGFKKQVIKDL